MQGLLREIRRSVVATIAFGLVLCGLYPLVTWAVGQMLFQDKANGSLLIGNHGAVGSRLIGQGFTGAQYFHPRPSAAGAGYDGTASGGSNLGPISRVLVESVRKRVADYRAENGLSTETPVPADAVTSSASGLDPHITVENALLQAARVARERGMSDAGLRRRIAEHTEGRSLGIFGEPRVNILTLNLALDGRL
jgi:potassium-transporting ATPase KdpC subunit